MKAHYTQNVLKGGDLLLVSLVPQFGPPPKKRRKREKATTPAQQNGNERRSRMYLEAKIYENFKIGDDYWVTLSYDPKVYEPQSFEEAERFIKAYLRRLNRKLAAQGKAPIKAIYTTERGGRSGRYHHHAIMDHGLTRNEVEGEWTYGRGKEKRRLGRSQAVQLQEESGSLRDTVDYMTKERGRGKKRWHQSGKLGQPTVISSAYVHTLRSVKRYRQQGELYTRAFWEKRALYKGYHLVEVEAVENEENDLTYYYARMRRWKE